MTITNLIDQLLDYYPKIYLACHSRHVDDPETKQQLSAHQASILDHLDEIEPTTLSELAQHMGVTPSTMSLSISRLVNQGYVVKAKDTGDKRVTNHFITEAGVRLRERRSVLDKAKVASVLHRLTPAEREQAIKGLGILAQASMAEMKAQSRSKQWSQRNSK